MVSKVSQNKEDNKKTDEPDETKKTLPAASQHCMMGKGRGRGGHPKLSFLGCGSRFT